jgi:signal transduction histidine kinase
MAGPGQPRRQRPFEEPDGRLWLASEDAPLLEVPPHARFDEAEPPRVQLLAAHADGRELARAGGARLPAGVERIDLEFRALSYREPARLRYRMRQGPDAPWSAPSSSGTFNLIGAASGEHQLEVAASLDGVRWSEVPARFELSVAAPWYQNGWVWSGFAALAAGLLYLAHAARLQVLLRLQRQRLRIARDLHDEMGSGLGSIGILAEVMSQEDVDDAERRALGVRIHGTVGALSSAMQDIVWSLRAGSE